jgi:hypothetical protein
LTPASKYQREQKHSRSVDEPQLLFPFVSQGKAKAGPDVGGQRRVSDGTDVLLIEDVVGLRVDTQPGEQLITSTEIHFRKSMIEIAVRQQKRITKVEIRPGKKSGVIAAAGERADEFRIPLSLVIGNGCEARVGRATEWPGSTQRRTGADQDAGNIRIAAGTYGIRREGPLDYGIEVSVTAAEKDIPPDPVLDFALKSLRAKRQGVDIGAPE